MPRLRAFADALALASLSLWLGVIVMSGLVAAVAFPTMKHLNPDLPDYTAFPHDHWKIAAGLIAREIFNLGALLQWGFATITATALAFGVFADRPARQLPVARTVGLFLAVAALAYWRLSVAPRMDTSFDAFLAAAKAGDAASAGTHRAAFDAMHPWVSYLLYFLWFCVLATLIEMVRGMIPRARPAVGMSP